MCELINRINLYANLGWQSGLENIKRQFKVENALKSVLDAVCHKPEEVKNVKFSTFF
jgi:hypothetical protein